MKKKLLFCAICLSMNSIAQVPNYVPIDGLQSWYSFNGNADDNSVNTNDGTVNGAVLTDDRFSAPDSAYNFDGIDDNIELPSDFDTPEKSISLWFNATSISTTLGVIYDADHNTLANGKNAIQVIEIGGLDSLQYRQGVNSAGLEINEGEWYMSTITVSDSSRFYLNDSLLLTTPISSHHSSSGNSFGSFGKSRVNDRFFDGKIDDIGIWDRALSICEIQDLYYSSLNSISQVTQTGVVLAADMTGATYQWLDCDNSYSQIVGETNQTYTPFVTGNYAVEVTINGCVDTSVCMLAEFTTLDELNKSPVSIYPNPLRDELYINGLSFLSETKEIIITSATGAVVFTTSDTKELLNMSSLTNGIYFLNIHHKEGIETIRFMKQ